MFTFNNIAVSFNGDCFSGYRTSDPYNPLDLPENTIRVRFKSGYTPSTGRWDSQSLVGAPWQNIWDLHREGNDWSMMFYYNSYLTDVYGASTQNVTNMNEMFERCSALSSVEVFNTKKVTDMNYMFIGCQNISSAPLFDTSNVSSFESTFEKCSALSSVPLYDTSKATNVMTMFLQCYNVQSGALALYNQMTTQANPPTRWAYCFYACGRDTQTGSAELAQIPDGWK